MDRSKWILSLAALAMIGLSILQYAWLRETIRQKEQEVITIVNTTLEEISAQWRTDNDINWSELDTDQVSQERMLAQMDSLIRYSFQEKGLPEDYDFGIINSNQTAFYLSNLGQEALGRLQQSEYQTCLSCMVRINFVDVDTVSSASRRVGFILEHQEQELIDHMGSSEEWIWYLHVAFPKWRSFLYTKARQMFGLSLLFSVLLLISFFYVFRQWKTEQRLNEFKVDFINNLTHEFKTPLASIQLATRTLSLFPQREQSQKIIDLIRNESKKMENRVENILQIGIIESGNLHLDLEEVSINQLLQNTLNRFKLQIEQQAIQVETTLDEKIPSVALDKLHMENVLYNLLDNAFKYTNEEPQIRIKTLQENDHIQISIQDNGIGIPAVEQQAIFHKFYRSENTNASGSGLGLNYVKQIIVAHRGQIKVESTPDQGSSFTIELPINAR
ncbi:MAG: HAMP domain-containing sensor histidine kinase [Bacteroidota bacterium]